MAKVPVGTPTSWSWTTISTNEIADGAVTAAKLASGAAISNIGYTPGASSDTAGLDDNYSFSRPSTAYKQDGTQVASGQPRYEAGRFAQALWAEEGRTNLIPSSYGLMTVDSNSDGVVDGFSKYQVNATSVYALDGGQKITLANVTNANGLSEVYLTTKFAVSPNTPYALSVDAALVRSGSEMIKLCISWYTSGGTLISQNYSPEINPGAVYSRQQLTATSPATAAQAIVELLIYAKAVGATGSVWFRHAMFEPDYATSFHESIRSPEVLTIPTGAFTKGNWNKEITFIPTSTQAVSGKTGYLWEIYIDANNCYACKVGPDGKPYLEVKSGGTTYQTSTATAPVLSVGSWYDIKLRGDGSKLAIAVNGTKVSEVSYSEPAGTLPANEYLGCDHNGANHANGLFDDARWSSRARTDAEWAAAYQSGAPLPRDEWTTWKASFDQRDIRMAGNLIASQITSMVATGTFEVGRVTADVNAKDYIVTGTGVSSASDSGAWCGYAVKADASVSGSAAQDIVRYENSNLRWGEIVARIRLKSSDASTANLGTVYLEYWNGSAWASIASKQIDGTLFDAANQYECFYVKGNYSTGTKMRVRIYWARATSTHVFYVDSITIVPVAATAAV